MNNLLYIDNNPTKPIIYIGVIFFSYNNDKKTHFLLMENNLAKYGDIGINLEKELDEKELDEKYTKDIDFINNNIIKALQLHTNYLIDLTIDEVVLLESRNVYIPTDMALIKFIKAPEIISKFNSIDFGSFTVKTNDEKIKRNIKWIDKTYLFRFLIKFKKISKRLNNKEILDTIRVIDSENNLNQILNNIHKKITKK